MKGFGRRAAIGGPPFRSHAFLARDRQEAGAVGRVPGDLAVVVDIPRDDENRCAWRQVIELLDRGRWSLPDHRPKAVGRPRESHDLILVVEAQRLAAYRSRQLIQLLDAAFLGPG